MQQLFCDGGTIGRNPSKVGGTWAYCLVENDKIIQYDCGILTPQDVEMQVVTNNLTELYAVVRGLQVLPTNWKGSVFTDSKITIYKFGKNPKFTNVPKWLRTMCLEQRRDKKISMNLLSGHPTQKELAEGRSEKGVMVSKWNVFCDRKCNEVAANYG